jgi:TolB-like protein/Tfp pilus assembly protein PilF
MIALIVFGYFIVPKLIKPTEQLEKSIAVLPFINDSPDQENTYFINGIMDEVLNNLQKIKDFRVLSRTSTEQYRGSTRPTIPKIANALDVNFIVEGSGQKYGNTFRLRVQLIAAHNERHLWAESYEQEINDTKDIFKIQSEVAQTIAHELKATITPEEKHLIEKTATKDLTAYEFYQRGREEEGTYSLFNQYTTTSLNKKTLEKAEKMYASALKCDSTFALAYLGLATLYWNKHYFEEYFSKEFLDSVLVLANIALSFDDQLAEAYYIRGRYYTERGGVEQALEEYDKAIKLNPNDWKSYYGKGQLYYWEDGPKAFENLQKAVFLNHSSELPGLLREISILLLGYGFTEQAKIYNLRALNLDRDSIQYYKSLEAIEWWNGNYKDAIEFLKKGYVLDSTDLLIIGDLAYCYGINRQFKESLMFYKIYIERRNSLGQFDLQGTHRIGYAFWENGYKKEAEYYFDKQIEYCNEQINLERPLASRLLYVYYDLAAVYAFRGDKDKAYKNLKIFNQMQRIPIAFIPYLKSDPLFENIRNEEEFQKIVRGTELKGHAERERLRKWLEEKGML